MLAHHLSCLAGLQVTSAMHSACIGLESSTRVGVRNSLHQIADFFFQNSRYDVIEAVDSDHAIAILEARRDVRVVFTDIQLPGAMDGLKLAHAVRHRSISWMD